MSNVFCMMISAIFREIKLGSYNLSAVVSHVLVVCLKSGSGLRSMSELYVHLGSGIGQLFYFRLHVYRMLLYLVIALHNASCCAYCTYCLRNSMPQLIYKLLNSAGQQAKKVNL